jgi:uncharacterized SAM-binding protein YcdF (DUF218 family)
MKTAFFLLSKVGWWLASPSSLLLIAAVVACIASWKGRDRLARWALSILCVSLLVAALFPVNEWLMFPLESRFPANPVLPDRVDGIIVLSGAEIPGYSASWEQPELNGAAERDMAFLALAKRFPKAKLVFAGGSGSVAHQQYKEAQVAKALFERQGMDVSRVFFEQESRNTFENVVYSKKLAQPSPGENWVLITSAFHMPRAVGIFHKEGWRVLPYPVDHNTWRGNLLRVDFDLGIHLSGFDLAAKEWIGLLAYYATGKTSAIFPSAQVN